MGLPLAVEYARQGYRTVGYDVSTERVLRLNAGKNYIDDVPEKYVEEVHRVSSPKVAEMETLLENIFRSVNIALVNELARLCDRMGGISMWEVVEAAATASRSIRTTSLGSRVATTSKRASLRSRPARTKTCRFTS